MGILISNLSEQQCTEISDYNDYFMIVRHPSHTDNPTHAPLLVTLKEGDGDNEYQTRTLQKAQRTILKRFLGRSLTQIKVKWTVPQMSVV